MFAFLQFIVYMYLFVCFTQVNAFAEIAKFYLYDLLRTGNLKTFISDIVNQCLQSNLQDCFYMFSRNSPSVLNHWIYRTCYIFIYKLFVHDIVLPNKPVHLPLISHEWRKLFWSVSCFSPVLYSGATDLNMRIRVLVHFLNLSFLSMYFKNVKSHVPTCI